MTTNKMLKSENGKNGGRRTIITLLEKKTRFSNICIGTYRIKAMAVPIKRVSKPKTANNPNTALVLRARTAMEHKRQRILRMFCDLIP